MFTLGIQIILYYRRKYLVASGNQTLVFHLASNFANAHAHTCVRLRCALCTRLKLLSHSKLLTMHSGCHQFSHNIFIRDNAHAEAHIPCICRLSAKRQNRFADVAACMRCLSHRTTHMQAGLPFHLDGEYARDAPIKHIAERQLCMTLLALLLIPVLRSWCLGGHYTLLSVCVACCSGKLINFIIPLSGKFQTVNCEELNCTKQ